MDFRALRVIELAGPALGPPPSQDTPDAVIPVENDDTVVVFVGEIDPPPCVDRKVFRLIEPVSGAADGAKEAEVRIENLQPVVAGVGDHDAAVGRHLDIVGPGIPIVVAATPADFADDRAVANFRHGVTRGAGDVDRAVGGDIDAFRLAQGIANCADEHARGAVHLVDRNAMIVGVGDQQAPSPVEGHVVRARQLARGERAEGGQCGRIEHLDTVVADIRDIEEVAVGR